MKSLIFFLTHIGNLIGGIMIIIGLIAVGYVVRLFLEKLEKD
jgi:uncharacterized membrane protein YphA (DoxX/SURF4 family)